jgi:hypothetical protein
MSKKNKKEKNYSSDSEEMFNMLKVLGSVVVVLVVFYLVFAIARGEISFGEKETKKEAEIQNVEIVSGMVFSKLESDYYVLMYDFKGDDADSYENLYQTFVNNKGTHKLFLVDLSQQNNKDVVIEDKSKVDISSQEKLKVVDGTLIHVKDGKGESFTVGLKEIRKTLLSL